MGTKKSRISNVESKGAAKHAAKTSVETKDVGAPKAEVGKGREAKANIDRTYRAHIVSGVLVQAIGSVHGGYHYVQEDREEKAEGDTRKSKWTSKLTVDCEPELKKATAYRRKVQVVAAKYGWPSLLGYVVPTEREDQLDKEMLAVQAEIREFNRKAKYSKVDFVFCKFELNEDNNRAAQALIVQVERLLGELEAALAECDPVKIRDMVKRAKNMELMLDTRGAKMIGEVVENAKAQAKAIVKRLREVEGDVSKIQKEIDLQPIRTARFAFVE